jgi:hypothetical protein
MYFNQVGDDSPLKRIAQLLQKQVAEIAQLSSDNKERDQKVSQLTKELDRLKTIDSQRPRR